MNSTTMVEMPIHRKLIDIPDDVFKSLNVKAAAMGTNLKNYIEELLVREMEDMEDAELYKYLVATRPEGQIMLSAEEQEEFERELGLGKYRK